MKVLCLNPPSKYSTNVARDLFYGCWCKGKRIAGQLFPPLNLLYVATVLKSEGHNVFVWDAQAERKDFTAVAKDIEKEKPEVLFIPTSTMNIKEDSALLHAYKKVNPGMITVAFGSHINFDPKQSLDFGGVDYGIAREPEAVIKNLINALGRNDPVDDIPGISYVKNEKLRINPPAPFIANLDDLPIPDRSYIEDFVYFSPLVKKIPWTNALTSRGCPGKCNFCTSPYFYGQSLRFRSAENVVAEMEYLLSLGYKEVFYRDETFTAHQPRLKKICELIIEKGIEISWLCNARIDTLNRNKETLALMKKAGCHLVKIGVESGSQTILDNIRKGIKVEDTIKVFRWMNEVGMESHAHMMLGCPGETKETVNQTIEFIKMIKPTTVTFNAFTLFPGTPMYEEIKAKVPTLDGAEHDTVREHSIGDHSEVYSELLEGEVGHAVRRAYKEFYLRPAYVWQTLKKMRSLDEFRRTVSAGLDVFSYATGEEE